MNIKYMIYILSVGFCAGAVSCNGIPAGRIPDGPIIAESQSDNHLFNGDDAVNYMLVALAMKCPPIANAGSEKPRIVNDFIVAGRNCNALQMEVWRRVIKTNMIIPVTDAKSPEYRLTSEIVKSPQDSSRYIWDMALFNYDGEKPLWKTEVEFTVE